jgi:integrase
MPATDRTKTKYPGVYYIMGTSIEGKPEKIYYIRYRRDGVLIEEKAGRQNQNDMTPAKANNIRSDRINGKEPSNKAKREAEAAAKKAKESKWTIQKLSDAYFEDRPEGKSRQIDENRYKKYLKSKLGKKEPKDIAPLDVDRIRISLLKKRSPQTVKHVLNLLTWIINYGAKKNLCPPLPFKIQKPSVNNNRTEDLNPEELKRLMVAIDADSNTQIKNLMKMALYTGMRRGELFKLKWDDIDFDRGFIRIRDPKGGIDQHIPLNDLARDVLKAHPKTKKSPYVFPGRGGKQRISAQESVNRIKTKAGLPKDFRPLHGLRHVYASTLASSGQVDMYVLQKLLTHKDPRMTQRYSHLRDEALKRASGLAGTLFGEAAANANEEPEQNIVIQEDHKQ